MKRKPFYMLLLLSLLSIFLAGCMRNAGNQQNVNEPQIAVSGSILQLESEVEAVYAKVEPAIVNITNQATTYDFFMRPVPQVGTGSGFLYDTQGHIVTNYHVIENAREITVSFSGGKSTKATIVGSDSSNDLAVIKVEAKDLPAPVDVVGSDLLKVGQFVIALGNPFGLQGTLTFGVISALGRTIQSPDNKFIGEAIQTDAPINPGNSGGPLLNLKGQVIGVNSQIISPSGSSAGIGFAVSSNTIRRVVPQLIAKGKYPHPWLGISAIDIGADWKDIYKSAGIPMPVDNGILVVETAKGSPAEKAGIRGGSKIVRISNYTLPLDGDIITAINNKPITSYADLVVYLEENTKPDDKAQVTFYRGREKKTVDVILAERPES